VYIKLFNLLRA